MPAKRKLPSDSILEKWVEEGLSHQEIQDRVARDFGEEVSLSSISSAISRAGLSNRVRYDDFIPWGRISADHNHAYQLTMLRIGARLSKGLPVKMQDEARFRNWSAQLKEMGVVCHYEYDSPEGFYYVPARPEDTGLVRMPEKKQKTQ